MLSISKKVCLGMTALLLAFSMQVSAGQCNKKTQRRCYTPAQVSVINPIQTTPSHCDVCGVRANILYGKNRNVSGLDIGLVNHVTGDMKGVEIGIVNNVEGDVYGVQSGVVNCSNCMTGYQEALINVNQRKATGFQRGFYNCTCDMNGVQYGLINFTRNLNGAQVGLINIQKSRKHFRIIPFINIAYTRKARQKQYCCPQQQPTPCYSYNSR